MLCILDRPEHPQKEPPIFQVSLLALEGSIADALDHVDRALIGEGIDAGLCGDVGITLGEVLNNVVEHACAGLAGAKVWLQGGLTPTGIWIEVCDSGRPFADGVLPLGEPANLSVPIEALPEGGFGWFLIRSLTSGIAYRREDGKNHLKLHFDR